MAWWNVRSRGFARHLRCHVGFHEYMHKKRASRNIRLTLFLLWSYKFEMIMIRPSSIMWCNMVSAAEVVELFHIRWPGHLRTFKLGPKMSSHVILAQRGKSPPPAGPLSDDVTWLWCFFHVNYLVKCQKCHHVILTQVSAWYDCLWSILFFSGIVRYSKACVCGWVGGGA